MNFKFQISNFKLIFFLFAYLFIWLFGYLSEAYAQEATSVTTFPSIQDVQVQPGIKTRAQVTFRNNTSDVITGDVKAADFVVVDKNGKTEIIENPLLKPKYSASSWISLSDNFIAIPKNENVTLNLYVTPPASLTSCGYYVLVYFQPNAGTAKRLGAKTESASSITAKIGAIVNFTVQGKQCRQEVSIVDLKAPFFLEYGPIPVTLDLLNSGDIHISPKGAVFASNLFGGYVDESALKDLRIFPERVKEYNALLGHKWMLGRYKIQANISYADPAKTASKTIYVWVFPWRVSIIIILTFLILYFISRSVIDKMNQKTGRLEKEIEEEKEEIEKLRQALRKRE